ncbi:unnamed protein product, partial [marine sediment metagenome]
MGERRSKSWYEFEHGKTGVDKFNKGIHAIRARALAKLIAADKPQRIFEFAAGGSILALEVLKLLPFSKYWWTDFSTPAIVDAKIKLKDFPVFIDSKDIDEDYENTIWHAFDVILFAGAFTILSLICSS